MEPIITRVQVVADINAGVSNPAVAARRAYYLPQSHFIFPFSSMLSAWRCPHVSGSSPAINVSVHLPRSHCRSATSQVVPSGCCSWCREMRVIVLPKGSFFRFRTCAIHSAVISVMAIGICGNLRRGLKTQVTLTVSKRVLRCLRL